ncbi:MAG: HYC_CC_PP family protein [Flavobacteriales bacterium]
MRSLLSFLLSFIIVFSQMGIVQQTHFCGGKPVLKEYIYSNKSLSCSPEGKLSSITCSNSNHFLSKKPCCVNSNLELSITDKFQKKNKYKLDVGIPVLEYQMYKINKGFEYLNFELDFLNVFIKDIPIWNQSFLI